MHLVPNPNGSTDCCVQVQEDEGCSNEVAVRTYSNTFVFDELVWSFQGAVQPIIVR